MSILDRIDLLFSYYQKSHNFELNTSDSCKVLGISHVTLQKYRNQDKIKGRQLNNGEWRYYLSSMYDFLGKRILKKITKPLKWIENKPQGIIKIEPNRWINKSGSNTRRPEGQNYDIYRFIWSEEGWIIISNQPMMHISEIGQVRFCHPSGLPYFIDSLEHDHVHYPKDLPRILERLWRDVGDRNVIKEKLYEIFENIGKWINECEHAFPSYGSNYPFMDLFDWSE